MAAGQGDRSSTWGLANRIKFNSISSGQHGMSKPVGVQCLVSKASSKHLLAHKVNLDAKAKIKFA